MCSELLIEPMTLPGGLYPGNAQDTLWFGAPGMVMIHRDIPEKAVYTLIKTVMDNFDEFKESHAIAKWYSAQNTLDTFPLIPMHPGVIKYFKETGDWTSELDKIQKEELKLGK